MSGASLCPGGRISRGWIAWNVRRPEEANGDPICFAVATTNNCTTLEQPAKAQGSLGGSRVHALVPRRFEVPGLAGPACSGGFPRLVGAVKK